MCTRLQTAWNLIPIRTNLQQGDAVIAMSSAPVVEHRGTNGKDQRLVQRRTVSVPARLTWKDARGTMRFATGIARNVSEFGVSVECPTPVSIPMYRLVQVQLERDGGSTAAVPSPLLRGRVLSAVYRISPASKSARQGLALRLMVDPRSCAAAEPARATA